jgi:sigma-E factor negative regulatory protein RseC
MTVKEKIITHPGYISKIERGRAEVTVVTKSACASCEVKSSCAIGETKSKVIDVELETGEKYEQGQQVIVEMKQSMGSWAVLLGYFFPFLLVLLGLVLFTASGMDEGLSGLFALGLLVPYYIVLYTLKDFFKKRFSYHIREGSN